MFISTSQEEITRRVNQAEEKMNKNIEKNLFVMSK